MVAAEISSRRGERPRAKGLPRLLDAAGSTVRCSRGIPRLVSRGDFPVVVSRELPSTSPDPVSYLRTARPGSRD